MPALPPFLSFWGKAQATLSGPQTHPVAYHLLDVAASADTLLAARPRLLAVGARLLGLSPNDARRFLVAHIALHDLGKFAPAFQAKAPLHWPSALGPLQKYDGRAGYHTKDGLIIWERHARPELADRIWPAGANVLDALAPSIFGHHGRPVDRQLAEERPKRIMGEAGLAAAMECGRTVLSLLMLTPIDAPDLTARQARVASWWVAGLTTLADWLGSDPERFPYTAPLEDDAALGVYWEHARASAAASIAANGLMAPMVNRDVISTSLIAKERLTPAQEWAASVPLADGPMLFVLEDATGSGKTEAAQILVQRLLSHAHASGAYWAMPTQATANAMYERQAKMFGSLFRGSASGRPSLVLSHGQQRLHDGFRATVLDSFGTGAESAAPDVGEELPAQVACAAFLADDSRKALLADIGAGTIDQALIGILPSRFNTLRLLALSEKVLVVDEAHAYDTYMGTELMEVLRFHAALGGSAIVLSATLPARQRTQLTAAWTSGMAGGGPTVLAPHIGGVSASAYPLATVVASTADSGTQLRPYSFDAAPWTCRTVAVRLISTVDDAIAAIVTAQQQGAATVWIRNTVKDCLAAAQSLRERGIEPMVFHARFAQGDRQQREQEVMRTFGPAATETERRGHVLVATQVVEQSLDLDFDVMVSDVAPADLLVQRAGRLWRHVARDDGRPPGLERELLVLSPPPDDEPASNWLGGVFSGTAHVYRNAGVLWRTVRALARDGRIVAPDGIRALIEEVYGSDEVPDALSLATDRAHGRDNAATAAANYAVLKLDDGYDGGSASWVNDVRAPTRLSDAQTTVRLARLQENGTLAPWIDAGPGWKSWALSEVRVSSRQVPYNAKPEPRFRAVVASARSEWGKYEQDVPVLVLAETSKGVWTGRLTDDRRKLPIAFSYTGASGFAFEGREVANREEPMADERGGAA